MFINIADIKPKQILPGFNGRFIHSEHMTVAYWDISKNASIPFHTHPQEMIVNVISGELELTIDKEVKVLSAGMAAIIPSQVPHSAKGITDCKVIDVFYPLRPEYSNE